jgi:hypothetical protein
MMKRPLLSVLVLPWAILAAASAAQAQVSRCADCHLSRQDGPNPSHVEAWARSVHRDVGCERCHDGNAGTFEPISAHQGILTSGNPRSPVHRRNLPATCGACHLGPLTAFQQSRHHQLLEAGRVPAPSCSTCHDDVEGRLLSPKALASECNTCHGPRGSAPRTDRAREVREQYEALRVVRQDLKLADALIKRVEERERRTRLRQAYDALQPALTRAIAAGHKFVYDEMKEHLARTEQRVQQLLTSLANR